MQRFNKQARTELRLLHGIDMRLATDLKRLAHARPALKALIFPVLREASRNWAEELDTFRAVHASDRSVTHQVWAKMTMLEKYAAARKVAHQPLLKSRGLNRAAVRDGLAFMVYLVDKDSNKSKFYEGLIVPEGDQWRIIRRWGALTDSGETGRVDGAKFDFDDRFLFPTLAAAQRELKQHYLKRKQNGYRDAFGPDHVTPTGHKLPQGEYPVGLSRQVGFGWGTQSVTHCVPALREFRTLIGLAIEIIKEQKESDIVEGALLKAKEKLTLVAHADNTMARKLLNAINKCLRRVQGSPRFLPDPEGRALAAELFTIERYLGKQLSLCNV